MKTLITLAVGLIVGVALGAGASFVPQLLKHAKTINQPYANEQGRQISSLSSKDIEALKAGKGWGLAKPAEFNGYPGPAHIIELADELELTNKQMTDVQSAFQSMQRQAASLGKKLVDAERALDAAFINKRITKSELVKLLADAEGVRSRLRAVHLAAHLDVTPMLSELQKKKYAELRGYGAGGHDKHEGH